MSRVCLWCGVQLPDVSIPTHGDTVVRCVGCGAIYMAQLLVSVPVATWQQMANRTGWTVTRDDGSDVLRLTSLAVAGTVAATQDDQTSNV